LFNKFKKRANTVGGFIKYYGIEDYWLNTLTTKEHDEVKHRWSLGLNTNPHQIDKGNIKHTDSSKSNFLIVMAEGISDLSIKDHLLQWSIREQKPDVIDSHFNFMMISNEYKKMIKSDKAYYLQQIEVLEKDCHLYDEFSKEYPKLDYVSKEEDLPNYPSFKELAIAYERTGRIQEAIDISQVALDKKVNEKTSFEGRISKLKKKLT